MRKIALALAMMFSGAGQALAADAKQQTIPAAYVGTWVLIPATCASATSLDKIVITPRKISFYESDAFLKLGQLNEISDIPEFYGQFETAGELTFWEQTIRLKMVGRQLILSTIKDKRDPDSEERWSKCAT